VEIRFTHSARAQLLEDLASVMAEDPSRAVALVDRIEDVLLGLGEGSESGRELAVAEALSSPSDLHRLYYRARGETLWVLAVWRGPVGLE
jgi:plasmid stabilization system protein ParE